MKEKTDNDVIIEHMTHDLKSGGDETQEMFQSVLLLRSRESSVLVLLGSNVHWWGARASQGFNPGPEERLGAHKIR